MTETETRTPNYGRRIVWLAIFVVVLVGGYSVGWYYLAEGVLARTKETIARMNRDDVSVECANPVVRGFPFRLGVFCDNVAYANATDAIGVTAGNLRTAGQIYDPWRFVAELDGPATVATPRLGSLNLAWDSLRASVRWAEPLPERISMEGGNLSASTPAGAALATVGSFEAHMRPNGRDLDLASTFQDVTIDPALVEGRSLPILSGEYDITINDGVGLRGIQPQDLRGRSGIIRNASLDIGSRGGFTVDGTFSIRDDGLLDANLTLKVRDPQGLSTALSEAFPEKRREIRNVASALSFMGSDPTLPLVIDRGEAKLAFFKLGDVPAF